MTEAPPDPSRCPLCGAANQCSLANPATATLPCWCFDATIDAEALRRLPEQARDRACLCPRCAGIENKTVDAS